MLSLALLLQAAPVTPPAPPPRLPPLHGGPRYMICPVGGEQFAAWQPSMYSTYGERPDGRPYSYLPFPLPVPECPGNKLIAFDTFSEAERQKLGGLIMSDEYQRLIKADTTYYRAYWLAKALGRPKPQALGLLLSAIWQVSPGEFAGEGNEKGDPRLRRYQSTFTSEVRALDSEIAAKDRVWLQARAANAARQMRRFPAEAMPSLASAQRRFGHDYRHSRTSLVLSGKAPCCSAQARAVETDGQTVLTRTAA